MQEVLNVLEEIKPDVDYVNCTTLIDDGVLDSFDIISLINELCEVFDITIPATSIIPSNFNSVEAIWNMVQELED